MEKENEKNFRSESSRHPYIAHNIIMGGLGVTLHSHAEFFSCMLEHARGTAAK